MTDDIHETPATSPDFRTELAAQLAELVPEAIADGKLDVEKLKELLDDDVADSTERFGLFWPGKKKALRAAQEPTTATLKPDVENSKDWDTTKNVFIEGDNLEVLKILQKHYHAKIKMIYVDPPYNTGKDFVYPDNYKEGLDTYLEWTRQVNEEGKKVSTNSETEGRYHSNWLNMMYPRLKLARNLLRDDGVIFISIDDNEQDNLKKVCNEIFGESSLLATLPTVMNLKGNNDQFGFAGTHEYTLVYARNIESVDLGQFLIDDEGMEDWETDERGMFKRGANLKSSGANAPRSKRPNLFFPVFASEDGTISLTPRPGDIELLPRSNGQDMSWRWSRDKFQAESEDVIVVPVTDGYTLYKKQRPALGDLPTSKPKTLFYKPEYSSGNGTASVKALFDGRKVFDNPKPIGLLRDFAQIGARVDSIILDLFAGSSALAHAVMELNAWDGGSRRVISIQLPEPLPPESEAAGLGFTNVAQVARARMDKAGEQARGHTSQEGVLSRMDVGFRAYVLVSTAFLRWNASSAIDSGTIAAQLFDLRDSADDDASPDELLTEILLKQGYSLTETVTSAVIDGLSVRLVLDQDGDVAVLAYLDEHVKPTLDQVRSLIDSAPTRIVVLEDVFQGDDELKTNLAQLAKSRGIEFWTA